MVCNKFTASETFSVSAYFYLLILSLQLVVMFATVDVPQGIVVSLTVLNMKYS